jgi:integrase
MPAIRESITVEEGISVFAYVSGKEGWYVRKWNKPERRYRIKRIDGAETKEQALANFYKALVSFQQSKQRVNKKVLNTADVEPIKELVDDFHRFEPDRVAAGMKDDQAQYRRVQSLKRMTEYLDVKEIVYPSQIDVTTWEDYPFFRKHVKKNTRKTELKDIGAFCRNYLLPRGYLSNEVAMARRFIPTIVINEDDLDANPAMVPEDYETIRKHLKTDFINQAHGYKSSYTRRMFYSFIHILKNSGCRPSELLAVRRRDIEITNPKRWSETFQEWQDDYKLKMHIRKTKTGKKRDVVCRSNAGKHMFDFLVAQREYLDEHLPSVTTDGDSLIFGIPEEHFHKTLSYRRFDDLWNMARTDVAKSLVGNRFSDEPYTIYSTRSTFIEQCIADGLDVYLVARLCGNSVGVIQKYYDRHDVLNRADEKQAIEFGKRKPPEVEVIDLADV